MKFNVSIYFNWRNMSDLHNFHAGETDPAQIERTERAQSAIRTGLFQVTRVGPQQWTVKNGDKLPYTVSLEGNIWVCTCMDFQQRGPETRCKHIEGVRLSEMAQNQSTQNHHKEDLMDQNQTTAKENLTDRFDRILWELRQPLDMARVKRRQAPGSGTVPFLEGFDVIERANAIFGFAWSFELINEPVIVRWQKKILIWNQQEKRKIPQVDANGVVQTEEVGIVYITGQVTVELGGKNYSHADLGRCIFTGDTPEALDMALAGSATDCLKRCFRQCGSQFGNDLYDKEIAHNAGVDQSHESSQGNSVTKQSTPKVTTSAQSTSTPIVRKYSDGTSVNGNISEQEAFDSYKKSVGAAPASKEALRIWMSSKRTPTPSVAA
jgi:hypothetical protein